MATKTAAKRGDANQTWTDEEREAMKEHAREMKAARGKKGKADGEADLLAKIAEMPESDKVMAERIHAIVKEVAPDLESRTWYGMPAYAKDGKVLFFFQSAAKFKARYATFGFNEDPRTDEGTMWATSWAITKLTKADEQRIAELVKQAVG
jgi:uncharacterized protein YdhG (YjbR/CyaY superfamily)